MTPEPWKRINRMAPVLAIVTGLVGVGLNMGDIPPNKSGAEGAAISSATILLVWAVVNVVRLGVPRRRH
jgi:hypothetical protein